MAYIGGELPGVKFRNPVIPAAGPNVGNCKQLERAAAGGSPTKDHEHGKQTRWPTLS